MGSAETGTKKRKKIMLKPRQFDINAEMLDAWFARIKTIQSSKMTPEVRAQLKARASRQRSAWIRSRKCKKLESARRSMKKGFSSALGRMQNAKRSGTYNSLSAPRVSLQQVEQSMMEFASSAAVARQARQELSAVQVAL